MKRITTTLLTLVLLLTSLALSASTATDPVEGNRNELAYKKTKTFDRQMSVGKKDRFDVDVKFGRVTVEYWDKSEISVHADITASSDDESLAIAQLERVTISMERDDNEIEIKSKLSERNWSSNTQTNFNAEFLIKMPSWMSGEYDLEFGKLALPDRSTGDYDIELKYTSFTAGDFTGSLKIKAEYGSIQLGRVKTASIRLQYANKASIEEAETLKLRSDFTKLQVGSVGSIVAKMTYGSINIGSANIATIDTQYTEVVIDKLAQSITAETMQYGKLTINDLSSRFGAVTVDAQFTTILLKTAASANFTVAADNVSQTKNPVRGFDKMEQSGSAKALRYTVGTGRGGSINVNGRGYSRLTVEAL
jgi:hypothetical protein